MDRLTGRVSKSRPVELDEVGVRVGHRVVEFLEHGARVILPRGVRGDSSSVVSEGAEVLYGTRPSHRRSPMKAASPARASQTDTMELS